MDIDIYHQQLNISKYLLSVSTNCPSPEVAVWCAALGGGDLVLVDISTLQLDISTSTLVSVGISTLYKDNHFVLLSTPGTIQSVS